MRHVLFALALLGCDDGIPLHAGVVEPIRVKDGQFIPGKIAGANARPVITNTTTTRQIVLPGQAAKRFDGRVTKDAASVAFRLDDLGSGYWVRVAGSPDGMFPDELTWDADIDFDMGIKPGRHTLFVTAIDARGNAGAASQVELCVASRIPDNGHTCSPTAIVPPIVATLQWDQDVDLDLVIVGSDGTNLSAKHPSKMVPDPMNPMKTLPTSPDIDRDSMAGCVRDAYRQEDFVVQDAMSKPGTTKPASGTNYDFYASLFDACGKPAVTFVLTIYEAQNGELAAVTTKKGRMIALDAIGSPSQPPVFIGSYTLP